MAVKLTVCGGGVLGSQIAYQAAYVGMDVTIWLRSEGSIGRTKPKIDRVHKIYVDTLTALKPQAGKAVQAPKGMVPDIEHATPKDFDDMLKRAEDAYTGLKLTTDLADSVKDADFVIECTAEDKDQKIDFFTKLRDLLPAKTILLTNTSTMVPSTFAPYTGRPEKFLAMHFANNIWQLNTTEIMPHPGTSRESMDAAIAFSKSMNMVPIPLKREQPQYILNNLLTPLMYAAIELYADGVADPEVIDTTWKVGTGASMGPCEIIDMIGAGTLYHGTLSLPEGYYAQHTVDKALKVLKHMVDTNKTGINSGEGFYKYD